MATTRFKTTTDAIKGGLKNFSTDKAIQNIEGWEEYLHKHDHEGVKAVLADLGKLKKLLQADKVDSEAIGKLLEKVGKDTVKVAGKGNDAEAKHIRELGEALSGAANDADEDDDDEESAAVQSEDDEELDEDEDDEDEDDELDEEDDDDDDDEDDDIEVDDDELEVDEEDDEDEEDADEDEDEPARAPAKKAAKKAPAKKAPAKAAAKKSK